MKSSWKIVLGMSAGIVWASPAIGGEAFTPVAGETPLESLTDGDALSFEYGLVIPPLLGSRARMEPGWVGHYYFVMTGLRTVEAGGESISYRRSYVTPKLDPSDPALEDVEYCSFLIDAQAVARNDSLRMIRPGQPIVFGAYQAPSLQGSGVFPEDLTRKYVALVKEAPDPRTGAETSVLYLRPAGNGFDPGRTAIHRVACRLFGSQPTVSQLERLFKERMRVLYSAEKAQEAALRSNPRWDAVCEVTGYASESDSVRLEYSKLRRGLMKRSFYGGGESSFSASMSREGYEDRVLVSLVHEHVFYLRGSQPEPTITSNFAGFAAELPSALPEAAFPPWVCSLPHSGGVKQVVLTPDRPIEVLEMSLPDHRRIKMRCELKREA